VGRACCGGRGCKRRPLPAGSPARDIGRRPARTCSSSSRRSERVPTNSSTANTDARTAAREEWSKQPRPKKRGRWLRGAGRGGCGAVRGGEAGPRARSERLVASGSRPVARSRPPRRGVGTHGWSSCASLPASISSSRKSSGVAMTSAPKALTTTGTSLGRGGGGAGRVAGEQGPGRRRGRCCGARGAVACGPLLTREGGARCALPRPRGPGARRAVRRTSSPRRMRPRSTSDSAPWPSSQPNARSAGSTASLGARARERGRSGGSRVGGGGRAAAAAAGQRRRGRRRRRRGGPPPGGGRGPANGAAQAAAAPRHRAHLPTWCWKASSGRDAMPRPHVRRARGRAARRAAAQGAVAPAGRRGRPARLQLQRARGRVQRSICGAARLRVLAGARWTRWWSGWRAG
jgi:hypothetical protein